MSNIRTLDRAFSILEIIAQRPDGMGVTAIANELELAKSTISRLLATMESWHVVERTAMNHFRVGPALARWVGYQPFTSTLSALARPILQSIADEVGEAVAICVLEGVQVLYLDHVQSHQNILVRDWTGELLPLHVTSAGKILLAYASTEFVDKFLERPLQPFTEKTIVDPLIFRKELERVRKIGYAMTNEEFGIDIIGFSVPIFNKKSDIVAALNLYGPKFRLNSPSKEAQIIKKMKAEAKKLVVF